MHSQKHEELISFLPGQLQFIDCFLFLLVSLNQLVATNNLEAFQIIGRYKPDGEKQ